MAPRHLPIRLAVVFLAWKFVLLIVATFSPGSGYDTSALIASSSSSLRHAEYRSWSTFDRISLNTLRWDALYFTKSAQRGYLYEQEWAFSWLYSMILKALVKFALGNDLHPLQVYVWAGLIISNICHLVSVLVLHRLLNVLLGQEQNGRVPFIASILHILSPAGMFLSAPYAESLFAAINFSGMLLYAQARTIRQPDNKPTMREDALILGAGILFMLATWVRSNGLLSGLLFVFDVVSCLLREQLSINSIRRLVVTCISGILLGLGSILPQCVAYQEYCTSGDSTAGRPWCYKTIPSIYTWVQSHYWNVGFLRYWSLSNLPLFVMAGPMLWLLLQSSAEHLRYSTGQPVKPPHAQPSGKARYKQGPNTRFGSLPQLALPQLVLAITAATNFHVQVINRLSSGYPVWYLAVARWITVQGTVQGKEKEHNISQWVCRGLIMYAVVQGALFANFLPPA